jgi:hypothetical protein
MHSWVYLLSKFTPEALLFESLIILILVCAYTAFWILRKRRYGSIDNAIPSGPIKSYLNELITNAEQLRLQLFGLLASSDYSTSQIYRMVGVTGQPQAQLPMANSSGGAKEVPMLEAKIVEQQKALEALTNEKTQLTNDLAQARAQAQSAGGGSSTGGDDSGAVAKLQQRIQDLENRLAEYNVIEDDLANLKRLQQENQLLKSTLTSKGIPIPIPGAAAPATPSSNDPAPESTPSDTGSPASAPQASAPASGETPTAESGSDVFAGLAGQVEGSLQSNPPSTEAAAGTPSQDTSSNANPPPTPVKNENEKAEADLVAEFEKMLKG